MVPDRTQDSFLRLKEVCRRTGLSRASIYRRAAAGEFPSAVPVGDNCVRWYESDVGRWVADPLGWKEAA